MSLIINHNMMAMNAARNLNSTYGALSTSTRRLSSGLRVGTAADDAAGLAIREMMRADIASTNQGVRNANDAISMIQVADGALQVVDEKLIRMKELATQAATGTYSSDQRLIIDSEFQAMASEINRIANATKFNGINLLDGSLQAASASLSEGLSVFFQFNGNANDSQGGPAASPQNNYSYVSGPSGQAIRIVGQGNQSSSGGYVQLPFIDLSQQREFSMTINVNEESMSYADGEDYICYGDGAGKVHIGHYHGDLVFGIGSGATADDIKIPYDYSDRGKWISLAMSYDGTTLKAYKNGSLVGEVASDPVGATTIQAAALGKHWWGAFTSDRLIGSLDDYRLYSRTLSDDEVSEISNISSSASMNGLKVHFGTGNSSAEDYYYVSIGRSDTQGLGLASMSVSTQMLAQTALGQLAGAIVVKDKIRANLGAMQNRLSNTIQNLQIQAENLQSSESQISDTDVAQEMTEFTKEQILTQSATAMLAQANSLPKMALQLIQGG